MTTPAYAKPTNKRITPSCTPRVCNNFEIPMFNIGSDEKPRWIQINRFGTVNQASPPKDFIPLSNNKGDEIVLKRSGIDSDQQKKEFQKFSLVKNAREIVNSKIVYQIFPTRNLDALDDTIDSPIFSVQDYVTSKLQQMFLPWPLSLIHLLPDWMVLTGLVAIILMLIQL